VNQPTLFDRPLARASDPSTSHEAAADLVASGTWGKQKRQVYAVLCLYPGRTSAELAEVAGLDRYMLARRLPDLEDERLATKGSKRRCDATGRKAVTWWPVLGSNG